MKTYPIFFLFCLVTACTAQNPSSTWNNAPDLKDGFAITNPASVGINEDWL